MIIKGCFTAILFKIYYGVGLLKPFRMISSSNFPTAYVLQRSIETYHSSTVVTHRYMQLMYKLYKTKTLYSVNKFQTVDSSFLRIENVISSLLRV